MWSTQYYFLLSGNGLIAPLCVQVYADTSTALRWKDGRIGTFRAIIKGPQIYGGTAYTSKGAVAAGGY